MKFLALKRLKKATERNLFNFDLTFVLHNKIRFSRYNRKIVWFHTKNKVTLFNTQWLIYVEFNYNFQLNVLVLLLLLVAKLKSSSI